MQKRPMDADNRGLLSAVLSSSAGENTADFAGQCTLDPQTTGLIEKVAHLRAHVSETGRRSDDDCIRTRQAVDAGDRYMRERRPGLRRSGSLQSRLGNQLRNLVKLGRHTGHLPGRFGGRFGHPIDMPIHAVKDDLYSGRHGTHSPPRWRGQSTEVANPDYPDFAPQAM